MCEGCICVHTPPSESAAPSLLRDPCGPGRGSRLWLQVYLKLLLVYLMNGCLGQARPGGVENESRMLMCVFKGENGEVVITISTATVIRRFFLPEQVRKSCSYCVGT